MESYAAYHQAKFEGLALREMQLREVEFYDCHFLRCDLGDSQFSGCRFAGCTFVDCDLSLIVVKGSVFSEVRFEGCKMVGVNWTQADWEKSKLGAPPEFERCAVSHSTFLGLSLPELLMRNCIAHEMDFREVDMTRADFTGTDLAKSIFLNTILTEADLSAARNYAIAPHQNILTGARFSMPEALSLLFNMDIRLVEEGA
jgi:uncharacterized protein YjbI with pentapeptide repeats